jgi:hypothetical protein
MEHEFWKWARSYPKITKDIIEYALAMSGAANVRQGKHAQLWPSKRSETIFEKGKRFFLDVGGWYGNPKGFAHTDFGLVSGNYVLVCSWLNMEGKRRGQKYHKYCVKHRVTFTEKIRTFFDMPKGAIVAHFKSPEPFVSDKELIVFLPDLHLHLCRETVIDNFKFNCNFGAKNEKPKIVSLEGELAEFLKCCQSLDAKIIQVGDCFEVWEAQAHLIDDHMFLDKARKQVLKKLRKVWEKMWKERKALPRDDYQFKIGDVQHRAREAEASNVSRPLKEEHVDQLGVPIDDTYTDPSGPNQADEIVLRTMTKYPKIFANEELKTNEQNMPFLWLRGNHDNMRANHYYEEVQEKDYKLLCSRVIKQSCASPEAREAYDIYRGGIDQCVWAEHGHRLDSANSDSIFDSSDRGYDVTRFYTLGRIIGESGWLNGSIELTFAEVIGERFFYYMRGEQLNLVYDIFNNEAEVRLIVMGHTHTAALVDWGIFLREVKRGVENYIVLP